MNEQDLIPTIVFLFGYVVVLAVLVGLSHYFDEK